MNLSKSIGIFTLSTVALTAISVIIMTLQSDFHANLFKLGTFLFYTSILLSGNFVVIQFTNKTSLKTLRIITFLNLILIIFSGLILFDTILFSSAWQILLGVSILYILTIQLTILGWTNDNHSIFHKVLFLIILLTNLFLASVFLFTIDTFELQPLILTSVIISALFLFVSTYINSKKAKNS
jgi:hypothetical protein